MNLSTLPITVPDEGSRGGVHIVEWKDHGLKVTVSKLREQSNGGLLADFDLHLKLTGPFKYFSRFNLKSGQTKASTARDLARVAPEMVIAGEVVWRYIVEFVSNYVRTAFNKGEEGVELINSTASEDTEYRLWPFIEDKQASMIFGTGASGKSFFALLAGYLIATGREHLGMKPQQGNVCYLDYDADEGLAKRRLRWMAKGFGEELPPAFHYMHMRRPLEDEFDRVNTYLMKHKINFVIIDHAARAVLEAEASGAANQYFNVVSGFECTTLTVGHVSKTGKEDEPFGSFFWYNDPRGLYRVFGKQAGSVVSIALRNVKANNGPTISRVYRAKKCQGKQRANHT